MHKYTSIIFATKVPLLVHCCFPEVFSFKFRVYFNERKCKAKLFVKVCHQHVREKDGNKTVSINECQKHTSILPFINLSVKYFFKKPCITKYNIALITSDLRIAFSKTCCTL